MTKYKLENFSYFLLKCNYEYRWGCKNNKKRLQADLNLFQNSVDRVASVSTDKKDGVKFNISKDKLDLSVNNANSGDGKARIVSISGTSLSLGTEVQRNTNVKNSWPVYNETAGRGLLMFNENHKGY